MVLPTVFLAYGMRSNRIQARDKDAAETYSCYFVRGHDNGTASTAAASATTP